MTHPTLFPIQGIGFERRILAAGPLSKQPHSMHYRIVLIIYSDGSYSVHDQMFQHAGLNTTYEEIVNEGTCALSTGFYFKRDELVAATKKFGERVAEHAHFLGSIYRDGGPIVAQEAK